MADNEPIFLPDIIRGRALSPAVMVLSPLAKGPGLNGEQKSWIKS